MRKRNQLLEATLVHPLPGRIITYCTIVTKFKVATDLHDPLLHFRPPNHHSGGISSVIIPLNQLRMFLARRLAVRLVVPMRKIIFKNVLVYFFLPC
jgi:hypothetical protein